MGSSRRPKSTRATSASRGKHRPHHETRRKAKNRSRAKLPEIPAGVENEIEKQRRVLVTVITLLHGLHVVLEQRDDSVGEECIGNGDAAVGWVYLPDITEMLLERIHAVHLALDSICLIRALKAFGPKRFLSGCGVGTRQKAS